MWDNKLNGGSILSISGLGRLTAFWLQGVMTDDKYLTVVDSFLGR
ncbi:hypothetical protein [Shewanella sp. S1-58-MNA-CIBAN-0166]